MSFEEQLFREFERPSEILSMNSAGSQIAEFYSGKKVFVTGATGFLGKLLVEKLLRACPEIESVSILVRPKKGEDEYTRVDKLYSDVVFGPLKKLQPRFKDKINVIKGDTGLPGLGINSDDKQYILDNINVFFHVAATVKFDEKLNLATAINVRSTRDLLNMCKECRKLESFVYVGTAYSNCNQKDIGEVFYDAPMTADELITLCDATPEEALLNSTKSILGNWPNTYVFTKAISENAVKSFEGQGLPVCVFRPAIVISTYNEPIKRWIDNIYGAVGVTVGSGVGLLKSMHCHADKSAEVVPADYVINGMIAASYKTALEKPQRFPIYNYVSSAENRITWNCYMNYNEKYGLILPPTKAVWYYSLTLNRHKSIHFIYSLFLHFLPAIILDTALLLIGRKPIMTKVYKKVTKFESVLSFFSTNQWNYDNTNTRQLYRSLNEKDRQLFCFDMKSLDWQDYYRIYICGVRLYLLKDEPSNLAQAKRKWMMFRIAHNAVKFLVLSLVLWVLYRCFLA